MILANNTAGWTPRRQRSLEVFYQSKEPHEAHVGSTSFANSFSRLRASTLFDWGYICWIQSADWWANLGLRTSYHIGIAVRFEKALWGEVLVHSGMFRADPTCKTTDRLSSHGYLGLKAISQSKRLKARYSASASVDWNGLPTLRRSRVTVQTSTANAWQSIPRKTRKWQRWWEMLETQRPEISVSSPSSIPAQCRSP